MEISRRDHHGARWNPGSGNRNPRFSNGGSPPINYNPWNKRYSPIDPDYQPDHPHGPPPPFQRGPHPYRRPNNPRPPPRPTNVDTRNIPSLLAIEVPPIQPMLNNDVGGPSSYEQYEDEQYEEEIYEEEEEVIDERAPLTDEEYLREEQKTKQQIERIIAVAQALREKLDREEELRRQAESIPKLMDLKPRIPSLLEIYVPPPPPQPKPDEICWNCNRTGHRFIHCKERKQNRFCYKCGEPGFDVVSCPTCRNR